MMGYLMNPFFDDLFDNTDWNAVSDEKFPPVDVYETKDSYVLEANLPGYEEKDLDLHVENHVLRLSSRRKMEKDSRHFLVKERAFVPFERAFSLPENVKEEGIAANFTNGVLTVTMPKVAPVQPKRIDVKLS